MKKIVLVLLVISGFVFTSNAQVMKKGDNALSFGIGIPEVSGKLRLPAFTGAFDMGVTDKLGIGYISGGVQVTLSGGKNDYGFGWVEKTTNIITGARAAYHFDFLDISGNSAFEKLDIYAGFFAGVLIEIDKDTYTYAPDDKSTNVRFKEDVFVGIRYSFSDAMAVYAEAGYNIAYLSGGISFSF